MRVGVCACVRVCVLGEFGCPCSACSVYGYMRALTCTCTCVYTYTHTFARFSCVRVHTYTHTYSQWVRPYRPHPRSLVRCSALFFAGTVVLAHSLLRTCSRMASDRRKAAEALAAWCQSTSPAGPVHASKIEGFFTSNAWARCVETIMHDTRLLY